MEMENKQKGEDGAKKLVVCMSEKLNTASKLSSNRCIYKVPRVLRKIDEEAYTPQLVSIGLFHHDMERLRPMEEHKWRYLYDFLEKDPKNELEYYVNNMRSIEEKVRNSYAEIINNLKSDQFVQMMLLDGCFLIELILKYCMAELRHVDDPIFESAWMLNAIRLDMALLENQLPFFILEHLFNLINGPDQRYCRLSFLELSIRFFKDEVVLGRKVSSRTFGDVVSWKVADKKSRDVVLDQKFSDTNFGEVKHFVHLLGKAYVPSEKRTPHNGNESLEFIPSATDLQKAGVKFKRGKGDSFLDVGFRKGLFQGVFEIPPIKIDSSKNTIIRNMIAFEHFDRCPNYISQYITLMDTLINTADDVAILRQRGIINNWLSDNEELATLFNKLRDGAMIENESFYYAGIFEDVNTYYKLTWHSWQAKLKGDYFNSLWALISLLAAIVLLFSTVVQTVFAVFLVLVLVPVLVLGKFGVNGRCDAAIVSPICSTQYKLCSVK